MTRRFSKLMLPDLKFDHHELHPVLSKEAMILHHTKHHQAYVNNYNALMDQLNTASADNNINESLRLQKLISFNLGGHFNHAFFWENLAPESKHGGVLPSKESPFMQKMLQTFGSIEDFKAEFNRRSTGVMGSGWGWLAMDPKTKDLRVVETVNQETASQFGLTPLMTVDVWEHAYYVDFQNLRPKYLDEIWRVIDWNAVEGRFNEAMSK